MNIIQKLTLRHLMENKKRSFITILGIAFSTALISAIFIGCFSFLKFMGDMSVESLGNYEGVEKNLRPFEVVVFIWHIDSSAKKGYTDRK